VTSPVLRHIELPPGPGTRVTVHLPAGSEMLGGKPLMSGDGFTLDFGGDVWRSVLLSARGDSSGVTVELEIEGRYPG
jgi:hypothetical protein